MFMSLLLGNMAPGQKKLPAEADRMRTDMDKWAGDLVPLDREEINAFALTQERQQLSKGLSTSAKGVFTTIYHEPVMAYTYRKYLKLGKREQVLLLVRTKGHEFVFQTDAKGLQLSIDGQPVGTIKDDGGLYGAKSHKLLATVKRDSHPEVMPIVVYDREVASVTKALPPAKGGISPRAFEFVKSDLTREEELLFLSLSALELIKRHIQ